jgi:hypothetical protein
MNPLIEAYKTAVTDHTQRMGAPVAPVVPAQRSTAATNDIDPARVSTLADSILAAADVPKTAGERLQKTLERIKKRRTEQALLKQSSEEKLAAVRDDDEDLPNWKTDPTTGTTESDDDEMDPDKPNEDDRREELSESSKLLRDAINNSKNQDYTSALPGWKRSR